MDYFDFWSDEWVLYSWCSDMSIPSDSCCFVSPARLNPFDFSSLYDKQSCGRFHSWPVHSVYCQNPSCCDAAAAVIVGSSHCQLSCQCRRLLFCLAVTAACDADMTAHAEYSTVRALLVEGPCILTGFDVCW